MSKQKTTKSWKKYFIEFLMLFLAVTLGFFADNIRDSFTNKNQEKEYILSMIEDAKNDRLNIKKAIHNNEVRKKILDSLSKYCYYYNANEDSINYKLYRNYMMVLLRPDFLNFSELTVQQLKNAGGMRLIKNKNAINEIIRYNLAEKQLENQQNYYENYQNKSIALGMKIFNHQVYDAIEEAHKKGAENPFSNIDFALLDDNSKQLKEFSNHCNMYGGIVDYYKMLLENVDARADTLINTLQKEYKIDTK